MCQGIRYSGMPLHAEALIETALGAAGDPGAVIGPGGEPATVATIFDGLAGFAGPGVRRRYAGRFEVVASPGGIPSAIFPGDILIGRAFGEGRIAWAETVLPTDSRLDAARLPHNVMLVRPRRIIHDSAQTDGDLARGSTAPEPRFCGEPSPWAPEAGWNSLDAEDVRDPPRSAKLGNTFQVPFQWICRIAVRKGGKFDHGGCGVLISDRHVLTAAHVVYDVYKDRAQYDLEVTVALNGNDDLGTYSSSSKPQIPSLYEPEKLDYDYALITLDSAVGQKTFAELKKAKLCFWGSPDCGAGTVLVRVDPKDLVTQTAYTAGYPKNKGGSAMWSFSGLLVSVPEKERRMGYTGGATEGQSGSPVWIQRDGQHMLVGVLVARSSVNTVVRVTREFVAQISQWMGARRKQSQEHSRESEDDAENTGPRGLVLLDHVHVPKHPDPAKPGTFQAGLPATLQSADLNPGFIDAADNLVTDGSASGLQTCLRAFISGSFPELLSAKGQIEPAGTDHVHVAVVDLTGPKIAKPEFAGWGSTVAIYGASVPKILALYGACQLRSDLRALAVQKSPKDGSELEKLAIAEWKTKGLRSQLPDLAWLFNIRKWTPSSTLDFTADVSSTFAEIMHNCPAGTLIAKVGLPYIGSLAWQSGLYHEKRGGLWLKAAYCDKGSWSSPVAVPYTANATALSAATYFTLLAHGRLVDDASSAEIKTALFNGCMTSRFPRLPIVASKCGIWKGYVHDCAWIHDSEVRYVMAVMSKLETKQQAVLYTDLCTEIDALVRKKNKGVDMQCG